jgi:fumarate reductase subunit C
VTAVACETKPPETRCAPGSLGRFAARHAVRGGLTAAEVLGRTRGNGWFLAFYALFVVAVAVHAPIGVRNILREWTRYGGRTADLAACAFALLLMALGMRAVVAVYLA